MMIITEKEIDAFLQCVDNLFETVRFPGKTDIAEFSLLEIYYEMFELFSYINLMTCFNYQLDEKKINHYLECIEKKRKDFLKLISINAIANQQKQPQIYNHIAKYNRYIAIEEVSDLYVEKLNIVSEKLVRLKSRYEAEDEFIMRILSALENIEKGIKKESLANYSQCCFNFELNILDLRNTLTEIDSEVTRLNRLISPNTPKIKTDLEEINCMIKCQHTTDPDHKKKFEADLVQKDRFQEDFSKLVETSGTLVNYSMRLACFKMQKEVSQTRQNNTSRIISLDLIMEDLFNVIEICLEDVETQVTKLSQIVNSQLEDLNTILTNLKKPRLSDQQEILDNGITASI